MGLKYYVHEAQARSSQASQLNSQAGQAITSLQQSIHSFLSAPLSSKAYDSAKSYFMAVYTPLCQSAIMTGEALESAHKRFLSEYQGSVSGIDTDEDLILEEINQLERLKQNLDQQMSTAKTPRPDLERRYMNACDVIEKRREKLENFHAYDALSASIFSECEACQQEFDNGLAQVKECKAWNPATGTFDISRLNMTWAKPINDRWKAREKMKQEAKMKEVNQAINSLDGYTIICSDLGTSKKWYLMKNGKPLPIKDYPRLYEQLDKCKDYLKPEQYNVEDVIVMKNEMPLAPGIGILGNLGKAGRVFDVIRKGTEALKVGQSISDIVNNAPTLNLAAERAIDDVLKDAEDTTKNKRKKPKNFEKDGEYPDALNDFDSLGLDDVSDLSNGEGMKGTLSDGRKVIVRPTSKSGGATIEIQTPDGKAEIKIRYKK
ncbi:hypothetical protein GIX45_17540 [Erwinia sp. CPCC 100877]|nr:hypothetical protein [Erwinia sp. CPCC 100877]